MNRRTCRFTSSGVMFVWVVLWNRGSSSGARWKGFKRSILPFPCALSRHEKKLPNGRGPPFHSEPARRGQLACGYAFVCVCRVVCQNPSGMPSTEKASVFCHRNKAARPLSIGSASQGGGFLLARGGGFALQAQADRLREQIRQRRFGPAIEVGAIRIDSVAAAAVSVHERHARVVEAVEPGPASPGGLRVSGVPEREPPVSASQSQLQRFKGLLVPAGAMFPGAPAPVADRADSAFRRG